MAILLDNTNLKDVNGKIITVLTLPWRVTRVNICPFFSISSPFLGTLIVLSCLLLSLYTFWMELIACQIHRWPLRSLDALHSDWFWGDPVRVTEIP